MAESHWLLLHDFALIQNSICGIAKSVPPPVKEELTPHCSVAVDGKKVKTRYDTWNTVGRDRMLCRRQLR